MPYLLIRHRVRDKDTWRHVFDDEAGTRRANGAQRECTFQDAGTGEVWLLLEWDDIYRAQLFIQSDDWRDALERAGVIDHPDCWYLEEG